MRDIEAIGAVDTGEPLRGLLICAALSVPVWVLAIAGGLLIIG